jgi:hypothetical protein
MYKQPLPHPTPLQGGLPGIHTLFEEQIWRSHMINADKVAERQSQPIAG